MCRTENSSYIQVIFGVNIIMEEAIFLVNQECPEGSPQPCWWH